MRLLLDTHVLLWWFNDSPKLKAEVRQAIAHPESEVLVSAASLWEIAIKRASGKLKIPEDFLDYIRAAGFKELPITTEHGWAAGGLPRFHQDPFDRVLIAQALCEEVLFATCDRQAAQYGVAVLEA
ncbi:MAG: type II toxin-antitoxin system VapC family toxin [Candidatus Sumerlaeaceae bacterium]|nr:type II toxin-antitoxin system VapC family toxin [Candidatus Sumerlaeaceae bacterium]